MNKFSEIRQGGIRDDLMFIKRLGFNTKKLNNDLWVKFGVSPREEEEEIDKNRSKKFISHPKRLDSDTDDNSAFSTPRRISISSSTLDLNADLGTNKLKIKKKLHKNLTQTEYRDSCHLDVGIGDSASVTPRYVPSGGQVHFERDKHGKIMSEIGSKSKMRNVTVASKKSNLSRAPSVQNSQRGMITESIFEKKFKIFVEKSLHIISDVRTTLDRGVPAPDGDEDMSRRTIRVKEFSNRFSRNYLYPLARQMDDLSKLDTHHVKVHHKLLSAYNVILNGLQAYHNHLPSSIGTCSSDKLKVLLKHVLQLCDIHNALIKQPDDNGFSDFVSTYKLNAELTLKKIDDYFTAPSTDSVLKSGTKVSLAGYGASKTNNPKNKPKKNAIESRLSMYSVTAAFRKDPQWKKAVDSFARKKLNVKSRYKTATYRHRPPIEKGQEVMVLPNKCKLFGKRSSVTLKKTPPTTPVGDNITTMVQLENRKIDREGKDVNFGEGDGKANSNETLNHKEIVMKLLHLVLDNTQRKAAEREQNVTNDATAAASTDSQIADILQQLRNEGNIDALQKVLDTLQRQTQEPNELQLKIIQSQDSIEEGTVKKRKEPIVTVSGENNVRLICIKDENSIIEIESNSESEKKDCQTEKVIPIRLTSSKTRTDFKKKEKANKQKSTKHAQSKMSRIPKFSKCLPCLPKNYAVNVIQYKLDFNKHCKTNPLYRKTASVTPWVLMAKISDKILDHALLTVAREIEVNDIAQQIYDSELQL